MMNGHGASKVLRFLRCTFWDQSYCLDMSWVRGIQRGDQLIKQPGDQGLAGWLQSDGGNIPVYRCTTLLGHTPHTSRPWRRMGKVLLLKNQPSPWGLLVDRDIMEITPTAVFPLPTIARNPTADCFAGGVTHEGKMMLALSPEGLCPNALASTIRPLPTAPSLETMYKVADFAAKARTVPKVLVFSTATDQAVTFGLSLSQVAQVMQPPPILAVPGSADYVLGLVEWRGVPLVVIDLLRRLGDTESPVATDGRLLVARAATTRACVGFFVSPQCRILSLSRLHHASSHQVPLQESLLRGQFELENETLVIPDIDRLLVPNNDCAG